MSVFINNSIVENARRQFNNIDLTSADILGIERSIIEALVNSKNRSVWKPIPIAPFAEPINLNELVGDNLVGAQDELIYQIKRVENVYSWLADTKNTLTSEIESVEKNNQQATDDIQAITFTRSSNIQQYYWISESFNSLSFIDSSNTTALIDTDYGLASLGVESLDANIPYDVSLDRESSSAGLPGANLLVIDVPRAATTDQPPQVTLESSTTRNLSNLIDNDSSTWFEYERNFIPPKQKASLLGQAYIYSEAGSEIDVIDKTKNLDWKVYIQWPGEDTSDLGPDGNGISLAEFVNLDSNTTYNSTVRLVLDVTFTTPTSFSALKILPFIRTDVYKEVPEIQVESIDIYVDNEVINIAKGITLGSNKSTTKLEQTILRRTGEQSIGSIYFIPTDREISKIKIRLKSNAVQVSKGLSHPFAADQIKTVTQSSNWWGLERSTRSKIEWIRKSVNSTTPLIQSQNASDKLMGSLSSTLSTMLGISALGSTAGQTLLIKDATGKTTLDKIAQSGQSLTGLSGLSSVIKGAGGVLGKAGVAIGKAVPYIGAALLATELIGSFSSKKVTKSDLGDLSGYDIFKGWRAAISLRDITVLNIKYGTESIVQTVKRVFPGPVSKIGLFIDEIVPSEWGDGDWITYYLSVDGTNWTSVPKITDTTLENSYTPPSPTSEIYFKAVFKGNEGDHYRSPTLKHFSLQGLPA